jgi:hypothetical protein
MHRDGYGVLNDFDLSTIMEPGNQNLNRQGLERTGTLPFMALELLDEKGFNGEIPRRYDHELESFVWVLVWVSKCVIDGEECRPPLLEKWLVNNNKDVLQSKIFFMISPSRIPTTYRYEWLESALKSWIKFWFKNYEALQEALEEGAPRIGKPSSEYLATFVSICQKASVIVPIDVSWVNSLADLTFTDVGRHVAADVSESAFTTLPVETTEVVENHYFNDMDDMYV